MALYTIQNNILSVTVNSSGAELVSVKGFNGKAYLWQGKKEIWPRHAPVLFPIVGRLRDNKFNHDGLEYVLTQHGFARDKEFALVEQSESSLSFELTDDDASFKVYPFHFSLIITYELKNNEIVVHYEVFNPDVKDLYFSIGAHPGFNCKQISGETLNDYFLEFENTNQLIAEKLQDGLLSGNTYPIELQNGCLKLSVELFNNDALVFKNNQINEVSLVSHKSGTRIHLDCKNWPYFGIWTKKGCDEFVCLEPWFGITDSCFKYDNLPNKPGILKLKSSELSELEYSIQILS